MTTHVRVLLFELYIDNIYALTYTAKLAAIARRLLRHPYAARSTSACLRAVTRNCVESEVPYNGGSVE
jgi:hypothetical protein